MYVPAPHASADGDTLGRYLEHRGVNRREFLTFCSQMAAVLGYELDPGFWSPLPAPPALSTVDPEAG